MALSEHSIPPLSPSDLPTLAEAADLPSLVSITKTSFYFADPSHAVRYLTAIQKLGFCETSLAETRVRGNGAPRETVLRLCGILRGSIDRGYRCLAANHPQNSRCRRVIGAWQSARLTRSSCPSRPQNACLPTSNRSWCDVNSNANIAPQSFFAITAPR